MSGKNIAPKKERGVLSRLKSAFSRMATAGLTNSPILKFQDAMLNNDANSMMHLAAKWRLPADTLGHALVKSVQMSDAECAEAMINAGADPNYREGYPLFFAINDGDADCVRVLLKSGADLYARNGRAYKKAVQDDKKEIMAVIEEFSTHRLHALARQRRKPHAKP